MDVNEALVIGRTATHKGTAFDVIERLGEAAEVLADEVEKMRATALKALAVPPGSENTHYGQMAQRNPVLLLASSYVNLKEMSDGD